MEYFKHYSTASNSSSLNLVFDKFGHKGIAFWWMLIELCAQSWDGISEPEFSLHQRTVVSWLKSSLTPVRTWLEFCSDSGLCVFAQSGTQFEIKIPNLKEIKETRGRIKGNRLIKTGIYRLDKDIDKEEDIDTESVESFPVTSPTFTKSKTTVDSIIQLFNDTLAKPKIGRICYCRGLGVDATENLLTTLSYPEFTAISAWKELFEVVSKSPFLTGQTKKSSWVVTLDWISKRDNALNILSGKYQPQDDSDSKAVEDHINSVELR